MEKSHRGRKLLTSPLLLGTRILNTMVFSSNLLGPLPPRAGIASEAPHLPLGPQHSGWSSLGATRCCFEVECFQVGTERACTQFRPAGKLAQGEACDMEPVCWDTHHPPRKGLCRSFNVHFVHAFICFLFLLTWASVHLNLKTWPEICSLHASE